MDPAAAADLLAELPEEQSDAILEEMEDRKNARRSRTSSSSTRTPPPAP